MHQKFNVGFCTFSYGGNGGISSEVPDIREWMVPLVADLSKSDRIEQVRIWNLSDTPITMTRNRAVLMARDYGLDVLVMVDSDMKPDINAGHPGAKPFFHSSFDFLVNHYPKGPCVIGAPYCGPPPAECVYVFRWQNMQSEHANPDYQLEMYDRNTGHNMTGIQECAALPTGLIMYDMRAFDVTEPRSEADKPWFYYEWKDRYAAEKASTEDVTMTRDLSLVGVQKLGYNPVFCNWDAWAGHWKPKCVGKPVIITAAHVSEKLRGAVEAGCVTKLMDLPEPTWLPKTFNDMGMDLPQSDAEALAALVQKFRDEHRRKPVVLEVGSWAGRSAIIMSQSGAAHVTCVDTWGGNTNDEGCKQYDGQAGSPFEVFQRNTAGMNISAVKAKSPDAAAKFRDGQFDIVYIDAEHDYESVKQDILAWKPKAKHILAGHDYHAFDGVKRAVADCGLVPVVNGNVWHCKL
jgi:hypothetical protein